MILYTSMPEELIFPAEAKEYSAFSFVECNGVQMQVRQTEGNEFEVVRILSTNPEDYLNEQYSPGQKITMSFSFSP
ncbi:YlzJ-like family protein [Metabacillus indicus]|uniref:YlzJ-like family protein n=1 Tax=Metabacillus indicus TaxID=246786 RepID=UPI0024928A44|nr:YlzJ-like family protein [Metabacillus indicus]